MDDVTGSPSFLLQQVYLEVRRMTEKVAELVTEHREEKMKVEAHVEDDKRQFKALADAHALLSEQLQPILSEQTFHDRMKAAVDDSKTARRSFWTTVAQVVAGVAAVCAVGVSIAAIVVSSGRSL